MNVLRLKDVSRVAQVAELISLSVPAVAGEPAGRAIVVLHRRRFMLVAFQLAGSVPGWLLSGHDPCPSQSLTEV